VGTDDEPARRQAAGDQWLSGPAGYAAGASARCRGLNPMVDAIDFLVGRRDLRRTAFVPGRNSLDTVLEPGQVLVHVHRFALTSNNVTYGAVGDMIGYWGFFPAEEGWGRIPVWGFGDVVRSAHDDVPVGERIYGYFPMSTCAVLQPFQVSPAAFVDASAHRAT